MNDLAANLPGYRAVWPELRFHWTGTEKGGRSQEADSELGQLEFHSTAAKPDELLHFPAC